MNEIPTTEFHKPYRCDFADCHAIFLTTLLTLTCLIQGTHAQPSTGGHSNGPKIDLSGTGTAVRMQLKIISDRIRDAAHSQAGTEGNKDAPLSCRLTVKPDGSIANISVLETSGSDEVDNRALKLIRSAAPFAQSPNLFKAPKDLSYLVTFPLLSVKSLK